LWFSTLGRITGVKVFRLVKILHLLFIDDVLIMSNDSPLEWRVIDGILKTCYAIGLLINWTKSTLHYVNIQEQDLDQLKTIFPHNVIHLSQGLHYLGYFIKADHYKTSVWDWLVSKVEKKLGH
jgi:hypothetical protein